MSQVSVKARDAGRGNRQSRRKQETRDRLIEAALVVMARKGPEAATIADITEEADVGFGSFYNHFQSKDEIRAAVMQDLTNRFGRQLDRVADFVADPVEVIAVSIRLVMLALAANPDWADFMANGGRSQDTPGNGLIPRLQRDLDIAESAGALHVEDRALTIEALVSAVPGMIQSMRRGEISADEAPSRITAIALRLLGVPAGVIATIMSRPLPPIPLAR